MTEQAVSSELLAYAGDPQSDEVIFGSLTVEGNKDSLSRYGDDAWYLWPMANKATVGKLKVDFTTVPIGYRDTSRRIVWSYINQRTPLDALNRTSSVRDRLAAGTIVALFHHLRTFLKWLSDRGIAELCAVTCDDFRAFAHFVTTAKQGRHNKHQLLFGVSRIWLISPYLPQADQISCPTWEASSEGDDHFAALLGPAPRSSENRTAPVHPQSMSALLLAAMRYVEVFGPDVLAAMADREAMRASLPTRQQPWHQQKLANYLRDLDASGGALPGTTGRNGKRADGSNLAVEYLAATLGVSIGSIGHLRNRPVRRGAPMPTKITGHVDNRPWCEAIDFYDVGLLRHYLMTACLIVVAYLSGMRAEECRALRRGCCVAAQTEPDAPAHYEIRGLSFKDARDDEGNTIPGGQEREHPWLVVEPVAKAIAMAEAVHDGPYVFTDASFKTRGGGAPDRAVTAEAVGDSVRGFIKWWNTHCDATCRPHERIPADPDGDITPVRFRRTLAWFIYRIPGGRIALGLQYGHLRGYTSDGYGSRVSHSLRDVFPMEEALAMADTLHHAARRLDAGEQVSGPAASRYIRGARVFQQTFEGTFLTHGQMAALRRNPALRIYDNSERALACVYDQAKALCHPHRSRSSSDQKHTPDVTRCRDECPNAARTDTHASILQRQIAELREEADNPLTPEPIRERILVRVERHEQDLQIHQNNRSPG